MLVGYARISTLEQNLDLQRDALLSAGCEKVFTDIASGIQDNREGLKETLNYLRSGDTLIVWKLDRLGRTLKHLIETVNTLATKSISFCSLQENLDTTTSSGKLIFHLFGALAEFERELIRERTRAGLKAARTRGHKGGRPRKLNIAQIKMAKLLISEGSTSITEICQTLGISRSTLYRRLKHNHCLPHHTDSTETEAKNSDGT
ncbi:recombinase family protein [Kamptonema sp. UHCC 0994]|uniref:recombinase family protein n=1 Tax=Kamptonema sp. UHCC 0994 TaxID=3031329 RepID=UPI0023B9A555|nr:recombinase family protein [Kamptonema sp. UHCC 0994]MDF0552020.1 recombinase family protein [Kamptonema sp. UHCC 0994]